MDFALQVYLTLVILLVFSIASFKKRLLDFEGVLIANIAGIIIFWKGSIAYFFLAVFFFIAAEAGTVLARKNKKKHETRTTGNIFGNMGAAILTLFLNFHVGFFAGIAAALADTLSSEIGMLSKKSPS